jgi:hypothetical protein
MTQAVFVGIDISKAHLDVAIRPSGERHRVANEETAIRSLVLSLVERSPTLVVLEATGGLETTLVIALAAMRLPVVVINPGRVRHFARAVGKLAKTDRIDAAVIAQSAETVRPPSRSLPDAPNTGARRTTDSATAAMEGRSSSSTCGLRSNFTCIEAHANSDIGRVGIAAAANLRFKFGARRSTRMGCGRQPDP